jgi:hypothetical protein
MELKSEPAFTETHVTDWEFATIGGTRAFTLEDGVDSCDLTTEGGLPCFIVTEAHLNERTVIYIGRTLIGYTQKSRVKKVPVKPMGPRVAGVQ